MSVDSIAKTTITVTDVIGRVAAFGQYALPVAELVADLFPGGGVIVDAIKIAAPVIAKIAVAAPVVEQAVAAGVPIADAIQQHGPDLLSALKQLYAIAVNADPERPETGQTEHSVSTDEAMSFAVNPLFGRKWTEEETQNWWDRAQGAF